MARFNATGTDKLELTMQEVANIPDDVIEAMLRAGSEVVVEAQKRKIRSLGLVKSGKLLNSIKAFSKIGSTKNDYGRYFLVYPYGKHGERRRKLVVKNYKASKSGRTHTVGGDVKAVTNSEVGFVQEFGAPKRGLKPKQWMRLANEESASAMTQAEFEVYDQWLKSKDL